MIPALGTRGDVSPYLLLGRALHARGHHVLLSTMRRFQPDVQAAGLEFHGLPGDPSDLFADARLDVSPRRPLHHFNLVRGALSALVDQVDTGPLADAWADADCVVFSTTTTFAHFVAGEVGARSAMLALTPAVATSAFAHPMLAPGLGLGRRGNLASWLAGERLARQTFQEPLKPAARRAWRLPAFALARDRQGSAWPPFAVVHAYSSAVVPPPDDWPGHVTVTGWLLPEPSSEPLADEVERFLGRAPAPLYIGFGSMPVDEPEHLAHLLVTALDRTRQRAIVCGGSLARASALQRAETVLAVAALPHDRLLHRVRAVIHHGGSGTVGAGLRAGRPTLVVPFAVDQFFWGQRIHDLGAGPPPLASRRLTERRLVDAVHALTSGRYDAAAAQLGERIAAEDGTDRAAQKIERAAADRD